MAHRVGFSLALVFGLLTGVTCVVAQDAALSELYGLGVHEYYAGQYPEAELHLTELIAKSGKDPRPYFFRGLIYSATGRYDEAEQDFRAGAELEAKSSDQFYDVSRSLQRVQGTVRLTIEKHRREARIAVGDVAGKRARARYEEFLREEEQSLYRPRRGATPVTPPPVQPGAGTPPSPTPPTPPTPSTPQPTPPPVDDPFRTPPTTPAAPTPQPPAATDPFGAPTPPAPPTPAAPTPQPPAATDPFGAPATPATPSPQPPGAADPFGNLQPAQPPAAGGATAGQPGAGDAAASGKKKGALRGLFRALGNTVPKPAIPSGMVPPGMPGAPGGGARPGNADPFGDDAPGPGNQPNDPFGDAPGGGAPSDAPDQPAAPGNDPFGPAPNQPQNPTPPAADNDPFGNP